MDFVVIGLGLSALALLTGLTLLCMVAPRWFRKSSVAHPADAAFARALAGERHALGQGFLCVGAVLLLATLGGISAGLADKAGAYLIAAMTTVAVLGLFGWDLLYRRQHPVPQRRRVAPARENPAAAEASMSRSAPSPAASPPVTTVTARRRVLPARQRVAPGPQPATATVAGVEPLGIEFESEVDRPLDEALASDAASLVTAANETEPGQANQDPATEPGVPDAPVPDQASESALPETEEPVSEEIAAGEPSDFAAELPEPVPFPPAPANGAAGLPAASASGDEPDTLSGDDRVIALFPTAEARRSRLIAAPADPDGKS